GTLSPGVGTNFGRLTFTDNLALSGTMTNLFKTGAGSNDSIRVQGNLDLSGGVVTVQIAPPTGSALIPNGSYVLFLWNGTLIGDLNNLTLAYPPQAIGAVLTLATNVSKQIVLQVSGNSSGSITWRGDGTANSWDHATANWRTSGGTPTVFTELDNVTFNDSGSNTPAINLLDVVTPSSVTFNNTNRDY